MDMKNSKKRCLCSCFSNEILHGFNIAGILHVLFDSSPNTLDFSLAHNNNIDQKPYKNICFEEKGRKAGGTPMKPIKKEFLELAEIPAGKEKALEGNPGIYTKGKECKNSPFFAYLNASCKQMRGFWR